jgi:hypothetical protein
MKDRIEKSLSKHTLFNTSAANIYIVDYRKLNGGDVDLLEKKPTDIGSVYVSNPNALSLHFNAFKDNALVINKGNHSQQCEGVMYPNTCKESDWVLFIECKYTYDLKTASDINNGYPYKMIGQIVDTVSFFRDKGILEKDRRATAIVSFPTLMDEFSSTFFSGDISELDILKNYNILIRATNSATIESQKVIVLNSI